jgi:hypothetical protein
MQTAVSSFLRAGTAPLPLPLRSALLPLAAAPALSFSFSSSFTSAAATVPSSAAPAPSGDLVYDVPVPANAERSEVVRLVDKQVAHDLLVLGKVSGRLSQFCSLVSLQVQ